MADVRIVSDTPCACCTTGDPACAVQCISTQSSGCAKDLAFDCAPITYPIIGEGCVTFNNFIPCPCEEPPAVYLITAQARLHLTGLTPGRTYTATVFFQKQLTFPIEEQFVAWTFVADAAEEFTPYTAVPNPTAQDTPGWVVSGCSVVGAECQLEAHRTGTSYSVEEDPEDPEELICVSAPVDDDVGQASWEPIGDDQCGPGCNCPPSDNVLAVEWRAHCTGLAVGSSYRVTSNWVDLENVTQTKTIDFTATAASQTTAWAAGPTPDASHPGWAMLPSCSILKLS